MFRVMARSPECWQPFYGQLPNGPDTLTALGHADGDRRQPPLRMCGERRATSVTAERSRRVRIDAWLDHHQPTLLRVLGIPGVALGVWVLVSSDGRLVPWRVAIVLGIALLITTGELRRFVRRRARRTRERETSEDPRG